MGEAGRNDNQGQIDGTLIKAVFVDLGQLAI